MDGARSSTEKNTKHFLQIHMAPYNSWFC